MEVVPWGEDLGRDDILFDVYNEDVLPSKGDEVGLVGVELECGDRPLVELFDQ